MKGRGWENIADRRVNAKTFMQVPWGETESRETSQGWITPTVWGYENEFGLWFVLPLLLTNSGTKAQWLVQCHWNTGWFWKWDGLTSLQLFCFIKLLAEGGICRSANAFKMEPDTLLHCCDFSQFFQINPQVWGETLPCLCSSDALSVVHRWLWHTCSKQ